MPSPPHRTWRRALRALISEQQQGVAGIVLRRLRRRVAHHLGADHPHNRPSLLPQLLAQSARRGIRRTFLLERQPRHDHRRIRLSPREHPPDLQHRRDTTRVIVGTRRARHRVVVPRDDENLVGTTPPGDLGPHHRQCRTPNHDGDVLRLQTRFGQFASDVCRCRPCVVRVLFRVSRGSRERGDVREGTVRLDGVDERLGPTTQTRHVDRRQRRCGTAAAIVHASIGTRAPGKHDSTRNGDETQERAGRHTPLWRWSARDGTVRVLVLDDQPAAMQVDERHADGERHRRCGRGRGVDRVEQDEP